MASTPLVLSTTFLSSKLYQTSHHHRPPLNSFPSSSSLSSKSKQSFNYLASKPLLFSPKLIARAASEERVTEVTDSDLVGEDSATFDLNNQKLSSWFYFTAILGVVLFVLNVIWIDDSTGFGTAFVDSISAISDSHEVVMLVLVLIFAGVHSGLASFRDAGEKLIGERAYRVLFAGVSLPLALTMIMVGQVMWCLAHTVWIGNSMAVAASFGLIAHHLFGVWNGDRKLSERYGEDFEIVKGRTSVVPFAAILDGRQKLPKDFYKEFIRLPYFTITALTLGAYFAHPLMRAASFNLHW
ncbi:hypothetical protein TSUD_81630 [Trifolium subterraneum]|uniref:NnrU domain-containing protein n=1 Tax=Trifolium subterraneum TaxID=3900 RepID=A0A2Z6LVI6_TRISU|nr:hypothetical protein TSUD_81630 [Trifolium subterraneum]